MSLVTRSSKNYNKTITYSNSIICLRLILAKIFYLSCLKIFMISENNNNHRRLNTVNKRPCHQQLTPWIHGFTVYVRTL
ncbi:unnamed protein product [Rhizophagus irregularis]|nr:unnamed protein product [Rhizophagus irregularis]CAB4427727.1 unnamed protein product [Rhizophagus irregularis]